MRRWIPGALMVITVAGACSSDDAAPTVSAPEGATFCSVFTGEYQAALAAAVPATDDGFDAAALEILGWAEVLADLAPEDVADLAADNVSYHRAQRDRRSASEFIPGSNALHDYASDTC